MGRRPGGCDRQPMDAFIASQSNERSRRSWPLRIRRPQSHFIVPTFAPHCVGIGYFAGATFCQLASGSYAFIVLAMALVLAPRFFSYTTPS